MNLIDPAIETMMRQNADDYIIPAEIVANVTDTNNLQHALLVLTKIGYSQVPVLDADNHFKGLLSMATITEQMLTNDGFDVDCLADISVASVMNQDVKTVRGIDDLERVLNILVDASFVPVVDDDNRFSGIVTRREVMKRLNFTAHNFHKFFDVVQKNGDYLV